MSKPAPVSLNVILEKIVSTDKDFRYMATLDLLRQLQNNSIHLDDSNENTICQVVLKQLEDKAGEISELAVKCLAHLVTRVKDDLVEGMLESLAERMVNPDKKDYRDIMSIGLKAVLAEVNVHSHLAPVIARTLAPQLVNIVRTEGTEAVSETVEVLTLLLSRFGASMQEFHSDLKDCLLAELRAARPGLRKRVTACLGALAVHLPDSELAEVNTQLLEELRAERGDLHARTAVQSISSVSRGVGYRYGPLVAQTVPLLLVQCAPPDETSEEQGTELTEYVLQALDGFVHTCPQHVKPLLEQLVGAALTYLAYDPNLGEEMEEDGSDAGGSDYSEDAAYSDDEDDSWKARRASAKLLSSIIAAFPDQLPTLFPQVCPAVVGRFKEREDSVRADVFAAFVLLVRAVADSPHGGANLTQQLEEAVAGVGGTIAKQLAAKGPRTQQVGLFSVLKELVGEVPEALAGDMPALMGGVCAAVTDRSCPSPVRLEALHFLKAGLRQPGAAVFHSCIKEVTAAVLAAVGERFFKVSAEALRVAQDIVLTMRPQVSAPLHDSLKGMVQPMFEAVRTKLAMADQDPEVKEAAIACMTSLLAQMGDHLTPQVPEVAALMLQRLGAETTRLAATRAFTGMASSELALDLSSVKEGAVRELITFLRKANRALRQNALVALTALVPSGGALDDALQTAALQEAAPLVDEGDLHTAAVALRFCTTVIRTQPGSGAAASEVVLPRALELVRSPLLQGGALEALKGLFEVVVQLTPGAFPSLLAALQAAGAGESSRVGRANVAACVAATCIAAGRDATASTSQQLLESIQLDPDAASREALSLMFLGALGRLVDLTAITPPHDVIMRALTEGSDEVKAAASTALGGLAVGSVRTSLPYLLKDIAEKQDRKHQYLVLQSLSLVISAAAFDAAMAVSDQEVGQILQLLLGPGQAAMQHNDECRGVVAECVGRLALLRPPLCLSSMDARLGDAAPEARAVVVTAVRYAVVEQPHAVDEPLHAALPRYLALVSDSDRHVRKAAVQVITAAAHAKPSLLSGLLAPVVPQLLEQTQIDKDLIRVVDLGPFKHKMDDGLELRKAAFECCEVVLTSCLREVDPAPFVACLESGLKDTQDIKLLCYSMLRQVSASAGGAVVSQLDLLLPRIEKTLTTRVGADAVQQEVDAHWDLVDSCLRAVEAVAAIPGIDACVKFTTLMKKHVLAGDLATRFAALQKEKAESEGGALGGDAMDTS